MTPNYLRLRHRIILPDASTPKEEIVFNKEWDIKIVEKVLEEGLRWNVIAEKLNLNDPVKIKNRFYNHIKRKNRYEEILQTLQQE